MSAQNQTHDAVTIYTRSAIQQTVRRIVEQFHPDQIVLFGSYAYGTPTTDSDVDMLVLMETHLSNVAQAVAIRQTVDFPFATDLLVRTPTQLAERLVMGDVFFKEILTKGLVLYDANHARVD